MWTKLTNRLQNSCCVVSNNLLQYVYWGNINTNKLTGLQIKLPEQKEAREKYINYVLSAFSFNCLPINYIEIRNNQLGDKKYVSVLQKCYIKAGKTYFSKSNTLFSTIPRETSLEDLGLVESDRVSPEILRCRSNKNSKLLRYAIKEIQPINTVYLQSVGKRERELEEVHLQERKQDYLKKTIAIGQEYKNLLEKEQKIKHRENELRSYFSRPWRELDTSGLYKVYAFMVNNKGKFAYVGVLGERESGIKCVYFAKGFEKNRFIGLNYDNLVKNFGFTTLVYRGLNIVYLPGDSHFLTFKTNRMTSYNTTIS